MQVGIIGGTGPAGTALGARLSANGIEVVLGSREEERGRQVARELAERHSGRLKSLSGGANEKAAACELVVLATPWEGAVATALGISELLSGKVVVSMINALSRVGREFQALVPVRGSMAATLQGALPEALLSAAFQHLPARRLGAIDSELVADVLVCADDAEATSETMSLVERIEGLRPLDAGSLSQAAAIEAFTAVCVTLNMRHRAHSTLKMAGI